MNTLIAYYNKARIFLFEHENPDITIEHKFFYRVMFMSGVVSVFFLVVNAVFHILNQTMTLMFIFAMLNYFFVYYLAKRSASFNYKALIYTIVLFFPVIIMAWFYNGGSAGGRQYIFFPVILIGLVVIPLRYKWLYIAMTLVVIFIIIYIEYAHPGYIRSYKTREAKYIDISVSFVIYGYMSWYIILYYMKEYKLLHDNLLVEKKKVMDQSAELEEANSRLLDLDRAKTDFFSNVSHEFKTPLTLIVSPVESIINGEYGKTIPIDHEVFISMYRNGVRLQSLIGTLLDITKIESGRMKLKKKIIDLARLADFCVNSVKSHAASRRIHLDFLSDKDSASALVDRELIESVIYNLLSNAFKFTEAGGRVSVAVEKSGDHVIITVRDTGIGIPSDKLPFIFDRFTQVDSGSSRKYEGTGIGLAFAKEIVELHGGLITADSRHVQDYPDGHGSCFTIAIPAAAAVSAPVNDSGGEEDSKIIEKKLISDFETVSETAAGDFSEIRRFQAAELGDDSDLPRILVVEDHVDMQHYIGDILKQRASVVIRHNGVKALQFLEETGELPDLILSDVMMPEMDGYTLTRELRKNSKYEGIPIILLTAKSEVSMRIEGLEYGATDYVTKPFSVRELVARINSQIQLKRLRDKLEQTNKILYQRLKKQVSAEPKISQSTEEKVKKVMEFIGENFTADLSREGLAAAVDLSPDHLSRAFNTVAGKRLDEYINELRIEEAKHLLKGTEESVLSIAFQVGFENVRTFNRIFQKLTGVVPTDFRTKY